MNIEKIKATAESIGRSIRTPVDPKISDARFKTCSGCTFLRDWKTKLGLFKTCGTPIKGSIITYKKKKVELCGCVMDQKVKDPEAECPVGKW